MQLFKLTLVQCTVGFLVNSSVKWLDAATLKNMSVRWELFTYNFKGYKRRATQLVHSPAFMVPLSK